VKNTVDSCIFLKVSEKNFIFLDLDVVDIFLVSSDLGLLHYLKKYCLRISTLKILVKKLFFYALRS